MDYQVNQPHNGIFCSNCGAPVEQGNAFCANCGTPVSQTPAVGFCNNCGAQITVGDAFCQNCGNVLTNSDPNKQQYDKGLALIEAGLFDEAFQVFYTLDDYADSKDQLKRCVEGKEKELKEGIYLSAIAVLNDMYCSDIDIQNAITNLKSVAGYKDSEDQIDKLEKKLKIWYEAKAKAEEEAKKLQYETALSFFESGEFEAAANLFAALGEYSDSEEMLKKALAAQEEARKENLYNSSVGVLEAEELTEELLLSAISALKSLEDYKDSEEKAAEVEDRLAKWYEEKAAEEEAERIRIAKAKKRKKRRRRITTFIIILLLLAGAAAFIAFKPSEIAYELDGGSLQGEKVESYTLWETVMGDEIKLPTPVKEGYTFMGWTGKGVDNPTKSVSVPKWSFGNLEYTAVWEANGYVISFDANGGSLNSDSSTISYIYGLEIEFPEPTKTGYSFAGWYCGDEKYESENFKVTEDLTLTAKWIANTYEVVLKDVTANVTVTYNYNYADRKNGTVNLNSGDILSYPNTPTRNGYVFTGWYTDAECKTLYDFSGKIESNITLYAGWKAVKSDVYSNDVINPYNYTSSTDYIRNSVGGTSNSYASNFYVVARESGEHKIYYRNEYSNSSYSFYISITNMTTGASILSETSCSSTAFNGISFTCNAGDVICITAYKRNYSTNVYLYFEGFNKISSTATAAPKEYSYSPGSFEKVYFTYDSEFTFPLCLREGATLSGWYKADGTKVEAGKWSITSKITLTPQWEIGKNTINLNANGGSVGSTTIPVTYGSNYTLPTPVRTGYTFDGWYNGNTKVTSGTWTGLVDVSLVAKWVGNSYSITYKDIANSSESVKITFKYNYSGKSDSTITLNQGATLDYPSIPSRSGYVFTGWYTDAECTKRCTFSGDIATDMTLYAGWKAMKSSYYSNNIVYPYNYTSSSNCYYSSIYGSSSSSANNFYLVANESGAHKIYYRNEYSSSSYRLYFTITNMTTGASLLSETSCTSTSFTEVSFNCNAGDIICISVYRYSYSSYADFYFTGFSAPTSTAKANIPVGYSHNPGKSVLGAVTFGSQVSLIAPSRIGYTFAGWYNGETKVENGAWSTASNVTLTPKWTANTYKLTLDANGGTVSSSTINITYDAEFTLPTPTRTGYTFDGWYNGNTKVESGTCYYTNDITLTAKWIPKDASVTYKDIGSSPLNIIVTYNYNYSGKSNSSTTVRNGYTLSYPTEPTRSGYVFTGWYTDSECKNRFYFGETLTQNITLYAGWSAQKSSSYSNNIIEGATYYSNVNFYSKSVYASSASYSDNIYVVADESGLHKINYMNAYSSTSYQYYITITNLTTGTVIKDSALCATNANYASVPFICDAGDVICISMYRYSSSTTAYLYFEGFSKVTSTSKCDLGSATYTYTPDTDKTESVTYGASVTLPTIYRLGYNFAGWYNGNTKVESGAWSYDSAVTLEAKWTAKTSKITLNANGGSVTSASVNATYGSAYTLPTPTRSGYTFIGWYNGNVEYKSGTWYGVADVTLTAKWVTGVSTVTFKDVYAVPDAIKVTFSYNYTNGGTYTTYTLSSGNTLSYPGTPTRSGYVFTGWYTDAACTTRYSFSGNIIKDMTLYAGWVAQKANGYSNNVYNAYSYTSSSNYIYKTIYGSSTSTDNIYFTAFESGTHSIYYKNSYSSYYSNIYVSITNLTTGASILANTSCQNTSYTNVSFTCNAGDVICVSAYKFYDSSNLYLYTSGFGSVTSTAKAVIPTADAAYSSGSTYTMNAVKGETFTLPTPYREGYTFLGWYNGNTKVESGTWNFDSNVTLEAKWQ